MKITSYSYFLQFFQTFDLWISALNYDVNTDLLQSRFCILWHLKKHLFAWVTIGAQSLGKQNNAAHLMSLPQTILSCIYIYHAEEKTRATLSNLTHN